MHYSNFQVAILFYHISNGLSYEQSKNERGKLEFFPASTISTSGNKGFVYTCREVKFGKPNA
ncbi:hypothetical protein GCM10028825_05890 [Spirosoma agri]